ncbi:MAG: magnesium/cobalt transporter CorA [Actinomycetota bacterium]|nr:magnesium/cobalt transporter CorA [Actinomycetota bacterium]
MRIYAKKKTGETCKQETTEGIELAECELLWIDAEKPTESDLGNIKELIGIHELALSEARKPSVPKIHEYPNHLFLVWNFIRDIPTTEKIEMSSVAIFLGENYLVTVHEIHLLELENIYERLEKDPSLYHGHPAPIVYAILDTSVDEFFPLVETLTENIDSSMEKLLVDKNEPDMKTLVLLKHRNMALRRAAASHRDVVVKLARHDVPFIPEELSIYMMDIYDHLTSIYMEVENNADLISTALDIQLNIVSNRLNDIMKRLTTLAFIFMPATFIVGLYGMNFKYMPELGWHYGYLVTWIVMIIITVSIVIIAKKKNWL